MEAPRGGPLVGAGRFAPSITGSAHPGTLLAALLAWLDARSRGDRIILRLEDLDRSRLRPGQREQMIEALAWLGLSWDLHQTQSALHEQHHLALDSLMARNLLYPCQCSRKDIRSSGQRGPDGGFCYPNTCSARSLPPGGWRSAGPNEAVRVKLPDTRVSLIDEGGLDLSQCPSTELGDPILVRRDGTLAYALVVVVDDSTCGITRVVRGNDLATSTATQILLQGLLGYRTPSYRHHMLLLESRSQKLAKLHGSYPYEQLSAHFTGPQLCGVLAQICGLHTSPAACTPEELLADFHWDRVGRKDTLFSLAES